MTNRQQRADAPTMIVPTEAEIREAVTSRFLDDGSLNARGQLIDAFSNACGVLDELYTEPDLRQSERDAIDQVEYDAMAPIRDRAIAELQEALVAAGLRFVAEHPDAPRPAPAGRPLTAATPPAAADVHPERRDGMAPATARAEAEIHAACRYALDDSSEIDIGSWVHELARPISFHPDDDPPSSLWTDLRPSEAKRLSDLLERVYRTADAWEAEIVDRIIAAVVEAGVTFAAEYPDAPRA